MKLFKQAYPADVWEAIFSVIAQKERQRPIRNIQRTVHFKGHTYEVGLNSGRDTIFIRWYVNIEERAQIQRKMDAWQAALPAVMSLAFASTKDQTNPYPLEQIAEAKAKYARIKRDMEQAQALLNIEQNIIFEKRSIAELSGFYIACETAFPDFSEEPDGNLPIRESADGQEEGDRPTYVPRPRKPRRKKTARKSVKRAPKQPPNLEEARKLVGKLQLHKREDGQDQLGVDDRGAAESAAVGV